MITIGSWLAAQTSAALLATEPTSSLWLSSSSDCTEAAATPPGALYSLYKSSPPNSVTCESAYAPRAGRRGSETDKGQCNFSSSVSKIENDHGYLRAPKPEKKAIEHARLPL